MEKKNVVLVSVFQRNRTNKLKKREREGEREREIKDMSMEAGKSQQTGDPDMS